MAKWNALTISRWPDGCVILDGCNQIIHLTNENIVSILGILPPSDQKDVLDKFQNEKDLLENSETSESLRPIWFEYVSQKTKDYRKILEDKKDIKQMKYLKSICSYNSDGTLNFIPLNKTFCKDITNIDEKLPFDHAQKLSEQTGYSLLTDYNDVDTDKQETDFYKIINLFNPYGEKKWDTTEARAIFSNMAWCEGRWYRTATPYKDLSWKVDPNSFYVRTLSNLYLGRIRYGKDNYFCVCGLKDSVK